MPGAFPIPDSVVRFNLDARGQAGADWLARLPETIAACARAWNLQIGPPFEPSSINYVAPAERPNGEAAVLKISFPDGEFISEAGALALYDGRASARLLEVDPERGALLLERVSPGAMLADIDSLPGDDDPVTRAAAGVMRRLWRPAPAGHAFMTFEGWVMNMKANHPTALRRAPAFPVEWIRRALRLFDELYDPAEPHVLLHGDLHHNNILSSEREGWLAIDPKGVAGPPVCETGPLLFNALPPGPPQPETARILERRTAVLGESLGIDPGLIRAWGAVRCVLSAYWSVEDHGSGWESTLALAELLENMR